VGYGQVGSAFYAKHPLESKEYMNYVILNNFLPSEVILAALSITGQRSNTIGLKLYSSWMPVDLRLHLAELKMYNLPQLDKWNNEL
jgi:hypothetical protein